MKFGEGITFRAPRGVTRASPLQSAARKRNWQVCRLRGLHGQVAYGLPLLPAEVAAIQAIVDMGLARIGAETEAQRKETRLNNEE